MTNILVTGATGTIGQRVVAALREKNAPVSAFVRDAAKATSLGVPLRTGTFEDATSLAKALAGVDTLVSITPAHARAIDQMLATIDAAKAAGVKKIVRVSAIKASVDGPTDNTRQHGRAEAALATSSMTYVNLRPSYFMQNLLGSLPAITKGQLFAGMGDGRVGIIDTRDVADAAVAAALAPTWDNQTFELTGPASIDHHAIASAISNGLGRTVSYIPVSPAQLVESLRPYGLDEWTLGIIRDYNTAYGKGFGDFTTDVVMRMTGHAPRSIDDFVRDVLSPAVR